jgi:hypothetical protein
LFRKAVEFFRKFFFPFVHPDHSIGLTAQDEIHRALNFPWRHEWFAFLHKEARARPIYHEDDCQGGDKPARSETASGNQPAKGNSRLKLRVIQFHIEDGVRAGRSSDNARRASAHSSWSSKSIR